MLTAMIVVFVIAYAAIALEHPLGANKTASALLGAGLLWSIYALANANTPHVVGEHLNETLAATTQVVFFLMGAMAIVEVVDAHDGFEMLTSRIKTASLSSLMWQIGVVTFFLSSVLDNLTTTIVMISLMKKLHDKHEDRLLFAGMIVIAANAGGAWTPIGDVTTTMLWIGGQVSTSGIMKSLFVPSLINLLVPLFFAALSCKGRLVEPPRANSDNSLIASTSFERNLMFFLGVGILMFVPVFKSLTHLPPFMGILFGLGFLWLVGELIHRKKAEEEKEHLTLANALKRIDMASVIFFVGILLAVATLEHTRLLSALARWLDHVVGRQDLIVLLLGLLSAIVDNVPLVAATMGMYSLSHYPIDHFLWKFIAYCAGTGGSILIIGSASGVAAMGLERISFFWYMRKVGLLALIGYFAGAMAYILQHQLLA